MINTKKQAIAKIAENIETINELIAESRTLATLWAIPFDMGDINSKSDADFEESDWDSSDCGDDY